MPQADPLTERFLDAGTASSVGPGEIRVVETGDRRICVAHLEDDRWGAVDDLCTHGGGALSAGELTGDRIECPRHGSSFNVMTGAVLSPPADKPLQAYPVRIVGGRIQVGLL